MSAEDARREAAVPGKAPVKLLKLLPLLYRAAGCADFLGLNRAVLHLSYLIQAVSRPAARESRRSPHCFSARSAGYAQ
jgi:hypothetical protein